MVTSKSRVNKLLEEECLRLQERIRGLQKGSFYDEVTEATLLSCSRALWGAEEALKRMGNGTYGLCEVCQNPIEVERLKILPSTTKCSKCARKER